MVYQNTDFTGFDNHVFNEFETIGVLFTPFRPKLLKIFRSNINNDKENGYAE